MLGANGRMPKNNTSPGAPCLAAFARRGRVSSAAATLPYPVILSAVAASRMRSSHEVEGAHTRVRIDEPREGFSRCSRVMGENYLPHQSYIQQARGPSTPQTPRSAGCPMSRRFCETVGKELRRQYLPITCHPEGGGSLAKRAIHNRRTYAFWGTIVGLWPHTSPP